MIGHKHSVSVREDREQRAEQLRIAEDSVYLTESTLYNIWTEQRYKKGKREAGEGK